MIVFADGTLYESCQGSWSEVAHRTQMDGMVVDETNQPVKEVHIFFSRRIEFFVPPTPRPCFAYKRLSLNLLNDEENEAVWLYTCFGYLDDATRVTLHVSPSGLLTTRHPRSFPFTP